MLGSGVRYGRWRTDRREWEKKREQEKRERVKGGMVIGRICGLDENDLGSWQPNTDLIEAIITCWKVNNH